VKTLGLIAGGGGLAFAIAREAKSKGVERVVVIAFPGQTPPELERYVDEIHWIHVGQLGALIKTFKRAGVTEAVMAGRLDPSLVISKLKLDMRMIALAARVPDRRADTVLKAIADEMARDGIQLLDSTSYLSSCLAVKGAMTKRAPGKEEMEDVSFGFGIAREIARLDIGQTVVVKKRAVVAVEAMEGTDEAIRRSAVLCPRGMVLVKVSRPEQDMRFDVPVIGERTIELLVEFGAATLGLEAGRTIILDRDTAMKKADLAGLAIVGV
jgi:DUF1009 family protein